MTGELLDIMLRAMLVENLALNFLLGVCTYVAISQRVATAVGLGVAMTVIQTVTVPLNNLIDRHLLAPGALDWAGLGAQDLSFLRFLAFIGVIAAFVQVLEAVLDHYVPRLHAALGIYLPLLTVNCAILGASLFMVQRDLGFTESLSYGFGAGSGWGLAVVLLATIRERLDEQLIPEGLRGLGITFVITGLLAMGFLGLRGLVA